MQNSFDVFNSVSDGVLIVDKNFEIVFANKAFRGLCGSHDDKITGKKCHEISHQCPSPCNTDAYKCPHAEVFGNGAAVKVLHQHCFKMEKFFDISASPIKNVNGKITHMVEVLRDVTRERILETKLKEANDFLRSVLDGIGEGVLVIDRDFRIISANKGFCRQADMSQESVIGKHCYEVSHNYKTPCYENGEECSVKGVFDTGRSHKVIHTHYDFTGRPVYIEAVSYPLRDSSGNTTSFVEVLCDISEKVEKQRIEERIRYLLTFNPVVVYTYHPISPYDITFISDNVKALLGYGPEEIYGEPGFWVNHLHPEDSATFLDALSDVDENGYHIHEYRLVCEDGDYLWVRDERTLIKDDNGVPVEAIGFLIDVSGHKELEDELKARVKELEDFYRMAIDRENKMIELKKVISRLSKD